MKIIELEEIDSTNEYLKRENFPFDAAVIAKRQLSGRGTKGRSFSSGEGGLYISVLRHYRAFPAADAFKILINACVSVCRTLESLSLSPQVRWANDVLVGGKKISGTLIENTFSGSFLTRSIVGIGINVNNIIPKELKDIATSVALEGGNITAGEAASLLLENMENSYTVEDYKRYVRFLGGRVTVGRGGEQFCATALDICSDGRLEIMTEDGKTQKLSAAEVSLRI